MRNVLTRFLERSNCTTTDCEDPVAALTVVTSREDLAVVFLDLTMPKITGVDLRDRIRLSHRKLPIVFISGFPEDTVRTILEADENTYFLQKPFSRDEFNAVLAAFTS